MSNTRYYVYSKNSATQKALKNAETREEARNWKRSQANPANFGIADRHTGQSIH
jgi:hypothetical protein